MRQKGSSSIAGTIEILSKSNQSDQFFKKMLEIKDKNIEDLLKELRQTKEIYQQYKAQYLSQQKKIKTKMAEISAKLDAQSVQLEKYHQINAKLKSNLESYTDRQKKMMEHHQKQTKQFKISINELQTRNKDLKKENNMMLDKQTALQQKCSKLQQLLKTRAEEAKIYEEQTRRIREELLRRQQQWRNQKKQLIEKRQQQAKIKAAKDRTNSRLDALQNKIKSTLMRI